MRKTFLILTGLLLCASAPAADHWVTEFTNNISVNVTNTSEVALSGYVESIHVDVNGVTTGTLVLATARETILTATVTADATYRPRLVTHTVAATAMGPTTNDMARALLCAQKLMVSYTETALVTNSVTTIVILDD